MSMAMREPYKLERARLEVVNSVEIWTDPDMPRGAIDVRRDDGTVLRIYDVSAIQVDSGLNR